MSEEEVPYHRINSGKDDEGCPYKGEGNLEAGAPFSASCYGATQVDVCQ